MRVLAASVVTLACAATALAQAPAASGSVVQLTLEDAVRRAVDNNADLALVRLEAEASGLGLTQAESAFTPVLSSTFGTTNVTTPPSNLFLGTEGVDTTDWFGAGTVRQRLRRGGGTWLASWDAARTGTDSPISSFDPSLQSNVVLAFSQPLLKDREIDAARQQLIITQRNQEISELQFREAVIQTVGGVKTAYWALRAAAANVVVQQESLALAEELARQTQARVDVGQLPPLDLLAAQAEVAQRREQLIEARRLAGDAEDVLRRLIMSPADSAFWATRLEAVDEPPAGGPPPDVEAAVRAALSGRLDVQQARKNVETADANIRYFDNQRLIDLRLEGSYYPTGLGGTRLQRDDFLGPVTGREVTSFPSVLGQVLTSDFPAWSLGLTLSYPLGRSYDEARLARAEIERRQAQVRVTSLELRAVEQVRIAARALESTAERIQATRAGADLAQQRLTAEQRRFEVGLSTSFLVTQAQRDLVQAQVAQLQATLDYQAALVAFETFQEAPVLGSATLIGLDGASVVPITPPAPGGVRRAGTGGVF
jgi:outer membrane protein TolC